ncbi:MULTISPECIES: response regulator transcription factor [Oceanimonas]|uniref:Response regulator transcription factor n=1 Tax=Oceanimonas smirnovii TaxID=264574 RepID=A0ABW7NYX6_9GAMM|nr:response regulator transcription factor [Oceanimonas sp. CAM02]MDV2857933.1 response regulator transcription factor [Oceanimonas sp. CAM02]
MRILVIEDTLVLGEAIADRLQKLGHGTDLIGNGRQAADWLRHQQVDLIILDLNLPGLNGDTLLAELRQRRNTTPVLILTARNGLDDRIKLLDLGADDYLAKPFDFGELEARVRALLRRRQGYAADVSEHGNLMFNRSAKTVTINGEPCLLVNREFRLLEIFLGGLERVMSKEELTDKLFNADETPSANAIELYVARLRKKLVGSSIHIQTLRGLGYVAHVQPIQP